jgi:hypothetical protein
MSTGISGMHEAQTSEALIRFEDDNALLMPAVSAMLAEFERQVKAIEIKKKGLMQRILEEMETNGILKIDTDELSITYVAPTSRESFDSKAFRKDNPDLYDEYVKISNVSASVRLKVK